MSSLVSFSAYAKSKNTTFSNIKDLVDKGILPIVHSSGKRLINFDDANIAWEAHVKIGEHSAANTNPNTLIHWKVITEKFKAKKTEIEFKEKAGELVSASDVQDEAFNTAKIIRDNLLSIPDRVAHELAAEDNPNKIRNKLTDEIALALEELSRRGRYKRKSRKFIDKPIKT